MVFRMLRGEVGRRLWNRQPRSLFAIVLECVETLPPAHVELPVSGHHSLDCFAHAVLLQHRRWPARVCAFHAVVASLVELVQ